jgi:predicted ATPase
VATLDGFELADADIPFALEICRRLDGVPLPSSWRRRKSTCSVSGALPRISMIASLC